MVSEPCIRYASYREWPTAGPCISAAAVVSVPGSSTLNNTPSALGPDHLGQNQGPVSAAPDTPSSEDVLGALDRLLHSDAFAGAARQQRLLRHLVHKRLEGRVGDLKEYTLGVEVFDRGDDFDPRLDPIVRVEASRLRSRLQKYYDGGGAAEPIRISLPRGGYAPSFAMAATPEPPQTATPPMVESPLVVASPALSEPVTVAPAGPAAGFRRWTVALVIAGVAAALLIAVFYHRAPVAIRTQNFNHFQRLTNDEALCAFPTFSPDAKSLAYARRDGGTWEIYQRDLATSAVTELTPGALEDNYQPAWSPDGANIAFRSDREGGGLFLLNTQSRGTKRLTNTGYYPTWSPDSSKIAFSTGTFIDPGENPANGGSAVEVLDLKSKQIQRVTPAQTVFSALQPAWSPHGNRIAFWDTDPNGDRDIWTVQADGTSARPVPVTHDAWTDWSPAWSPDGRFLYFSSDRGGAMNLWRVRIDEESGKVEGAPESVTTPSSYTGWTTFARNGKELAYVRRMPLSELYKVPFDPGKALDLNQKTALTAGERTLHEPDMSPDGQSIVVRVQDPQEDLALIRSDGSDTRRLTNDVYDDRDPHWSPDGNEIVFTSNRSRTFEVWAIHPDGTGLRKLTNGSIVPFAWDPSGDLVAYPANATPFSLLPPGAPVKNFGVPSVFRPIAWSPDKQKVVGRMRSEGFSRGALFVLTPATQDFWEIAPSAPYVSAVWLQNSRQLLFSRSEGIYLADVMTHKLKQELSTTRSDIHARFALSPDDRSLFFVESGDQQDIWIGQ